MTYTEGAAIRCSRTSEHASLSQSAPATFERFSNGITISADTPWGLCAAANGDSRLASNKHTIWRKERARNFGKTSQL